MGGTFLDGTVKNVEIPVSQLPKALDHTLMFDGSSIIGFVGIEESDMCLVPDVDTWTLFPCLTEERIARLICDVYVVDGTPFTGCPRTILKRVLKEAEEMGFTGMNVGSEPEFFLFKMNANGPSTLSLNDQGGYYDAAPIDSGENCRREIVLTLKEMGFEIEAFHHEVAPGQHEISFKYADAIKAADQIQTFKHVVKIIALQHHLQATFMAKPLFGISGSGMHCNISLFQGKTNAFYDEFDKLGLSEIARQFMAGILKHARGLTAITNPTVNSYKRLVPGYEAPCHVAWSAGNRSPMVRIPASRGAGTRIEVRHPDPSANPYLALAVILQAGLAGIKQQYDLPPPTERNIYTMTEQERIAEGISSLPVSLQEALDALLQDQTLCAALGDHALQRFLKLKQAEWNRYHTHVHQWERDQYLNLY